MTHLIAPEGKAIVKIDAPESITSTGIIIPESARENSDHATVVDSKVQDVEAGDRVLLSGKYAGSSFDIDGVEYVTVLAEEILAVIE